MEVNFLWDGAGFFDIQWVSIKTTWLRAIENTAKQTFIFFHGVSLVSFLYVTELTLNFKQSARHSCLPSYENFLQFCNPAWHWNCRDINCYSLFAFENYCHGIYIVNKLFHNRFFFFSIFKGRGHNGI